MEIVTEADIHSVTRPMRFLPLRTILRYLGVNSGDMEKGALRCEPNISVRTLEQKARGEYGTKVEVKNLNSFRSVRAAIAYEMQRQIELIESGGKVEQVNMGWDEAKQRTVLQRSKESSHDYRYFPGAGLAPAGHQQRLGRRNLRHAARTRPPRNKRYVEQWGLRPIEAETLIDEALVAQFFEATVAAYGEAAGQPQRVSNWITGELFRLLYADGEGQDLRQIANVSVRPEELAAAQTRRCQDH